MKTYLSLVFVLCLATSLCYAQPVLWGTTNNGGINGLGTIFKATTNGTITTVHNFGTGTDGQDANGSLINTGKGLLYGATVGGGANEAGMMFSYNTATGKETDLYDFGSGTDGSDPFSTITLATNGLLYGLTTFGGANSQGTIFSYNISTGIETDVYDFGNNSDGYEPYGTLTQASNGLLYGMTDAGGTHGYGIIFSYNISTGIETDLHDFGGGNDGASPYYVTFTQASNGLLYGVTQGGGANDAGIIFSYNISNSSYNILYNFGSGTGGRQPEGLLLQANNGLLYGLTIEGGVYSGGTIFSYNISTAVETDIHDFGYGTDGSDPLYNSPIQASNGLLYGLTWGGGANNLGIMYSFDINSSVETDLHDFSNDTDGGFPFGNLIEAYDTLNVVASQPEICKGESVVLTASGATTYTWAPAAGLNSTTGDTVIATPTITTTYTIVGMGNGNTNVTSIIVNVNNTSAPPTPVFPKDTSFCGAFNLTLNSGSTGFKYLWSNGDTTHNITVNALGKYWVSVSNNCATVISDTISVVVDTNTTLNVMPQSPLICGGANVTLSVSGGGSDFIWKPATGLADSSASGDSVVAAPTATVTYTVTGTDSLGCKGTGTDVVTVRAAPNKPTINVSVTGDTLFSSATTDNQWNFDGSPINGATDSFFVIKGHIKGWYTVTVTNDANGCSTTSDSTTSINQLSVISNQLSIYPNPFYITIFIKINSSVANVNEWSLILTDVLGRTLYTKPSLNYTNGIDLSNLPSGVYFITVVNKTDRSVFPVVKQN